MNHSVFTAERVSRTATILLHGSVRTVFPLFGPIEEKKWEDGWNPVILYPPSGGIEEGMVFTTRAHDRGETTCAWIVSKYQPQNHFIEYIISTENRYWVITIQCLALSENQTEASITYTFTGLNLLGNETNKRSLDKMYDGDLQNWQEAINHYLKTGMTLKRH